MSHTLVNNVTAQSTGGQIAEIVTEMAIGGENIDRTRPVPSVDLDWKIPLKVPQTSLSSMGFAVKLPFVVHDADYYNIYPTVVEYSTEWTDVTESSRYTGDNFVVNYDKGVITKIPFYWLSSGTAASKPRFYTLRFDCYQYGNATPFTFYFPYKFEYTYYNGRVIFNLDFPDYDYTLKIKNVVDNTDSFMTYATTLPASNTRTFSDLTYIMRSDGVIDSIRFDYHGKLIPFTDVSIASSHTSSTYLYAFFLSDRCTGNRICYHIYDTASAVSGQSDCELYISDGTTETKITDAGKKKDGTAHTNPYDEGDHFDVSLPITLEKGTVYNLIYKYTKEGETVTKNNTFSTKTIFPRLTKTLKL